MKEISFFTKTNKQQTHNVCDSVMFLAERKIILCQSCLRRQKVHKLSVDGEITYDLNTFLQHVKDA